MKSTEYYSQIANKYISSEDPFWYRYHQNRFNTFNSLVPGGGERILDFGCGSGENVVNLTLVGHQVLGIDPVPEMVELAKARMRERGLDPRLVSVGDLASLATYADGEFDIVSALNVLPYLSEEEEEEFYTQAKRLTPDDGWIIVSHTNELVDLVTFNRYTVKFWRDRIIPHLTSVTEERQELLDVFSSHLSHPDIPARDASTKLKSERDILKKRRVNPIDYPNMLLEKFNLMVDDIAFTHFFPMPPQFMEASEKYRDLIFVFEDSMKTNPLRYVFASIFMMRLKKATFHNS